MAYIGNTAQTYVHNQRLLRESLEDFVTITEPENTPFISMFPSYQVGNYIHEIPIDKTSWAGTSAQADLDTAHPGEDAVFTAPNYEKRMKFMCQINSYAYDVDNSSMMGNIAGTTNRLEREQRLGLSRLIRNAEFNAHFGVIADSDIPVQDTTNQGTADANTRKTDGLVTLAAFNGVARSFPSLPTSLPAHPLGYTIDDSRWFGNWYEGNGMPLDLNTFTRNVVGRVNNSISGFQADGAYVFCPAPIKALFNRFADDVPAMDRNIPLTDYTISNRVDVIETEYGVHYLIRDRYFELPTTQAIQLEAASSAATGIPASGSTPSGNYSYETNDTFIMVDPSKVRRMTYRGFGRQRLGPVGDSTKEQIVGEWGMSIDHPLAVIGATGIVSAD